MSGGDDYDRAQFLAALKVLGMSQQRFAVITETNPGTVYHWGLPGSPFPRWVPLLVAAWLDNKAARKPDRTALAA